MTVLSSKHTRVLMIKKVLLGDSHTTIIAGTGDVELKFTYEKTLILKDVMHTLEMRNNLFSNFFLIMNEVFVGKLYATDDMFKLNIDVLIVKKIFAPGLGTVLMKTPTSPKRRKEEYL
ncbi:hypothetical protein Lal_00018689 [Lupinus albus]|nr:hypothetical protein Lal_00018689 [Lupinus albus]